MQIVKVRMWLLTLAPLFWVGSLVWAREEVTFTLGELLDFEFNSNKVLCILQHLTRDVFYNLQTNPFSLKISEQDITAGELGPVRGLVTKTKAYPDAPYSERHFPFPCIFLHSVLDL